MSHRKYCVWTKKSESFLSRQLYNRTYLHKTNEEFDLVQITTGGPGLDAIITQRQKLDPFTCRFSRWLTWQAFESSLFQRLQRWTELSWETNDNSFVLDILIPFPFSSASESSFAFMSRSARWSRFSSLALWYTNFETFDAFSSFWQGCRWTLWPLELAKEITHMRGVAKVLVINIMRRRFWAADDLLSLFENLIGVVDSRHCDGDACKRFGCY